MDAIRQLINRIRAQITELWGRMEKKDRTRFLIISAASLLVIIIAVVLLNQTKYVSLFPDKLEPTAVGDITAQLDARGEKYELGDTGTILVPEKDRDRLFVSLATSNSGLAADLSIFQLGAGLGSNDFQQRTYAKFETEARLRRLITLNSNIRDASVIINIPDTGGIIFQSERKEITASVMLYMQAGRTLDAAQVQAVEDLVTYAVGMDSANISITDDSFSPLNRKDGAVYSDARNVEQEAAMDIKRELAPMLNAVVGPDRYRMGVSLALKWDDMTKETITFRPVVEDTEGIVRSMRRTTETMTGDSAVAGEAGFDENGGDVSEYPVVNGANPANYEKLTEETNYEIDQIIENVKNSPGTDIAHLSITVAVDNEGLSEQNQSLTADELRNMIGGVMRLEPEDYKNYIVVSFQQFAGLKAEKALRDQLKAEESSRQLVELIKILALYVLIAVCIIVLILRVVGLFRLKHDQEERARAEAEAVRLAAEREELELAGLAGLVHGGRIEQEIEEKRSPERERIEEFIERNPDAVAQLLRTWLSDEPEKRRR